MAYVQLYLSRLRTRQADTRHGEGTDKNLIVNKTRALAKSSSHYSGVAFVFTTLLLLTRYLVSVFHVNTHFAKTTSPPPLAAIRLQKSRPLLV